MPQYSNDNKQNTSCDPSKCKICRNKFSCAQYLDYLENIAQSKVDSPVNSSVISNETSIDLTELIQSNKETKDSLTEILLNKFLVIENENRLFRESLDGLTEKISRLDKLVDINLYDAQNSCENSGLIVYNDKSDSETVLVEKKGLFGKTKWVEEKVKKEDNQIEDIE